MTDFIQMFNYTQRIIPLLFSLLTITSICHSEQNLTLSLLNDPVTKVSLKVLQEAYKNIDIEIQYIEFPPMRALTESNNGRIDGEVNRIQGINKQYSNLIMIPVAVNEVDVVVFSKNVTFPISGWESLEPYKLGLRLGAKFAEQGTQGMDVQVAIDYKALFLMLDKGRFDIAVASRLNGLVEIKNLQLKEVTVLDPPLVTINLYHYLHKKHSTLIPAITEALQTMETEGRIKAIRDQAIIEVLQ